MARPARPTMDVVLTRRRALLLGAGSLLTAAAVPRTAVARSAGLTVRPGQLGRTVRAPMAFELLGLREAVPGVEVRARALGGRWTAWAPLGHGHGGRGSDPVWTGPAHELQLRASRRLVAPLQVHLVASGPVPRRAALRAARAQSGPPPIVPRAAWGGDQVPPRGPASYGQVQAAFVHHTVTANGYAPEQSAGMVQSIAKYHRDVNGWNDIGYNFLVDRFGQVFEGRAGGVDQAVVGAHCQGSNSQSTGIAVLGTHGDLPIEPAAFEALARLLGWKLSVHGVPALGQVVVNGRTIERIAGHRDGLSTECPGNALYAQLPALRERAAQLAGPVVAKPQATLAAAAEAVPYGAAARLTGAVRRGDGTPAAGEAVALQKQGTSGWVTIARAQVAGDGTFAVEVPWRRTGKVRAQAAGVTTPAIAIAALPRLGSASLPRRVRAGRTVLARGTIRPGVPVTVVVERQSPAGRWVVVARVPAKVRGTRWEARLPFRKPALHRVTAVTAAKDGGVRGRQQVLRAVRAGRSLTGGAAQPGTTPPTTGGLGAG